MNTAAQQVWNEGNRNANARALQRRRFTIDPITRLEGHGKIEIFLDDQGDVEHAYLQIPELRGFEVFSRGRPAEDMPQITSRICGVCPTAHHMAATKALDDLFQVEPPPAARKIRELVYNAFMIEDHALHVYLLGGPDFIVGPDAPKEQRNVVGVVQKVGIEVGKKVISMRRRLRELIAYFGGKVIHPVLGLPGGVYDGLLRVVDFEGKEYAKFAARQYADFIAEHVETWSYVKFCYLKPLGWHGFEESATGSIYAVAPLARLNVAEGMATPNAQKAYEEFFSILGAKPVHHTLANHWARIVEMIYAAERMLELVNDPEITHRKIREIPKAKPRSGIGVVEAPRGTLFHHFETDDQGLITKANLIVATQNNAARIAMSVDKAARGLIKKGQINEGLLNMVEMAFRAYDPCFGCATHALPGHVPLQVNIYDRKRRLLRQLIQS